MTLKDQMDADPMGWKDWASAAGLVLTMGTVLLQGGRIIERLDTMQHQLQALQTQQVQLTREVTEQRGIDRLHDEQINTLRRDMDEFKGGRQGGRAP